MQKNFYVALLGLLICFQLHAAAPTTPASNISFSSVDGGSVHINWTNGNGARRIIIARQAAAVTAMPGNGVDYFHDDDFGLGQEIAPGQFIVFDGTSNGADIRSLQPATTYFFTIYEYNGTGAATEYNITQASGSVATLSAPTTQASGITFSNVTGNAIKISWTAGNGSKRLVLVKEGSAVNANPTDLVSYNTSTAFGLGQQIGSGNYVVHFGTANTVTLTGLQPNTIYHFAVFEANGNFTPVYFTVNAPTGSQLTLPAPTVASSNLVFSLIDGSSLHLEWTKGNGTKRIVVARAGQDVDAVPVNGVDYLAGNTTNQSFLSAPEITPGQKVVYDHTSEATDITGLAPNTTYYFRIYEYDGNGTAISYMISASGNGNRSTATTPALPATNLVFSNVSANAMKLSWTNGSGTKRIVVARQGAPVDATPADLVSYSGQAQFGLGTQLGTGNYVVYAGTGNNITVTSLALNQTYHFAVFEANGINTPVYLTTGAPAGSQATTDRPTVASSNIGFTQVEGDEMKLQWAIGNGQKRIVVVSANTPVTAVPVDGVDYLATITSSFPSAPEIAPGQKVVYDNTGSSLTLTGLTTGTTYHYRIYEYSGTGGSIAYLTSGFASASQATLSAPTTAASNINFTSVSGNGLTLQWTNGNGARRIVVAKAGSPVDALPDNYATYGYSANFGNGSQLGSGNYVLANTTSNNLTIYNLNLSTTYHFAIFECNGIDGPVYLTGSFATASQLTADRPTVAPSAITFSSLDGNGMRVGWTSGNGQKRIIVARAGSPVDAVPSDGIDYLATGSAAFNTAPEIAPGQKVVYDNSGSFTDLTGLNPNTVYHFRIYEYSVDGSSNKYMTASYATGSQSTLTHPTLQTNNVAFTSITSGSMMVSWTAGNGSNRLVIARAGSPVDAFPADLNVYSSSNIFGSGAQLGSGNYVVAKTNGTSFTVSNLVPGTTYHFAVYEFNGAGGPLYLVPGATGQATTIGPPSVPATSAFYSNAGSNSLQLNWTNGSGNKRLVLMKQGAPVDALPVNNTSYFANSFFGSGTQIGTGNYVVYNGIQDFVTVTNLIPATTYHFAVFEYNDFGLTSQYLLSSAATSSSATGILPVRFIFFTASMKNKLVELQWATASETNSAAFEIQRSVDGSDYTTIGSITAAGNSISRRDYSFTDPSPASGIQYYRLKQMDIDGKWMFSSIVKINASSLVTRFTNPVSHTVSLSLSAAPPKNSRLVLYDLTGRMVKNIAATTQQVTMQVSDLPDGGYILQLRSGDHVEQFRLIKQ